MSNITELVNKAKIATGQVICEDIGQAGSGFFVNNKGYFITNNHVVTNIAIDTTGALRIDYSKKIVVKIGDNIYPAALASDENTDAPVVYDYAILKVNITPNDYFEIANLSEIAQGEEVLALGYPLNLGKLIATKGIISATISRPSHHNYLHSLKTFLTDTLISYGNSGGPLIRISDGKIIGINTMPHEISDEIKDRLCKYYEQSNIQNNSSGNIIDDPIYDLIEFVLKYVTIGFNYAVSIEYAMKDPILNS
jgi:S1-C subfamily serine protease